MAHKPALYLIGLLLFSTPLLANQHAHGAPESRAVGVTLEQAKTVSATFDKAGRLWLAWVVGEHLYVNHSDDLGKSYSLPINVNIEPQKIAAHGESRPQIAVASNGHIYIVYNQKLSKRFTGHVRFSSSINGGKSFSIPEIVNSDRQMIGHSFAVLAVNPKGHIYITWLDGRDAFAAKKSDQQYSGSSLYYTASFDGGKSFQANVKLQDHSCQCCRIAIALDEQGLPVMVWRHIFDNTIRDHALIRFTAPRVFSQMRRASQDNWTIDSCPHHGPALAIAQGGRYHVAWFTASADRPGTYYAYSDDNGQTFSPSLGLGDNSAQAQHPYILSVNQQVWIVWKAFDGERTNIQLIHSLDNGKSWSQPRTITHSRERSDHPFLIKLGQSVFLSWQTLAQGYRLIPLRLGGEK